VKVSDATVRAYATGMAEARPVSAAGLRMLSLELAPLSAISSCPFVSETICAVGDDVAAGHAASTLVRVRGWAARWTRVRPDIRAFYEREDVYLSPAGAWGLRRLLDGQGTASGPLRGELNKLWRAEHGSDPSFSLIPKIDL